MARWDDMLPPGVADEEESDDEGMTATHKAKPRRKSHQRPQGSDQIRQAFSKRKKGLVLKAYQLNALTDAKVFMFIVNDKGTSWAYATPGFAASLNPELLKELRMLANVPEQAKLITEVMPDPPNAKQPSSNGGSDHTYNTQRTDPGFDYAPPATRTATGALPARSRSSYSWGSEGGQAAAGGQAGGTSVDRLVRTASNAANTRGPQSDEHSPTRPRNRPPSGSSMAGGPRVSNAAAAAAAAAAVYSYQQQHQQPQQYPTAVPKAQGGMEPPTPCGMYNLLGQPTSGHDSPTLVSEVVMSCGGSPSSKLNAPGVDAAAAAAAARMAGTGAAAAAAAVCAEGAQGGTGGEALSRPVAAVKGELQLGGMEWAPQDAQAWYANMYQQQQQYQMPLSQQQQQYQPQQQDLYQQEPQQQPANGFYGAGMDLTRTASVDIPYTAGGRAAAAAAQQQQQQPQQGVITQWGSLPAGMGSGLLSNTDSMQLQLQQQQAAAAAAAAGNMDPFETMQRGLPPLRLARPPSRTGTHQGWGGLDAEGPHSAPAAGVNGMLGRPSQWVDFPDATAAAAATAADNGSNAAAAAGGVLALRSASDTMVCGAAGAGGGAAAGVRPGWGGGSFTAAPNSCAMQMAGSGSGSTPTVAAGIPNAAQVFMSARGASVSADPSPTAALSQRMCSILAMQSPMHSPMGSPLHPSAAAAPEQQLPSQQQQQQQVYYQQPQQQQMLPGGSWGNNNMGVPAAAAAAAAVGACGSQMFSCYVPNGSSALILPNGSTLPGSAAMQDPSGGPAVTTTAAVCPANEQQHNQGSYIPLTDDLVSDPIMDMLMDQPLGELTASTQQMQQQQHNSSKMSPGKHTRHLSIMEATMTHQQQFSMQQQQQANMQLQQQQQQGLAALAGGSSVAAATTAAMVAPPVAAAGAAVATQTFQQGWQPPCSSSAPPAASTAAASWPPQQLLPADNSSISSVLQCIPPPPKSEADKAAWQDQVRRILGTLQPQQRMELAKLSEQQWLMAQAARCSAASSSTSSQYPCSTLFPSIGAAAAVAGPAPAGPVGGQQQQQQGAAAAATGSFGRGFAAKQRHGPSRLSASSPAIDLGVGMSADVQQQQQMPPTSMGYVGPDGIFKPLSGDANEASEAAAAAAVAAGVSTAMPSCAYSMPLASLPMGSMGYCQSSLPQAVASATSCYVSYSGTGQMLPLPPYAAPMAAAGPALNAPAADTTTYVNNSQQPGVPAAAGLDGSSSPFANGAAGSDNAGAAYGSAAGAAVSNGQPAAAAPVPRPSTFMSDMLAMRAAQCSSPLKRAQPGSGSQGGFGAGGEEECASPLKRACIASIAAAAEQQQQQPVGLPEPPSFATLLQTELSEDDAVAWAVAASDSMKLGRGSSVSLAKAGTLGSIDSFPSAAMLRFGSMSAVDSEPLAAAAAAGSSGAMTAAACTGAAGSNGACQADQAGLGAEVGPTTTTAATAAAVKPAVCLDLTQPATEEQQQLAADAAAARVGSGASAVE